MMVKKVVWLEFNSEGMVFHAVVAGGGWEKLVGGHDQHVPDVPRISIMRPLKKAV